MADITIVREAYREFVTAGGRVKEVVGVGAFNSTDASGTLKGRCVAVKKVACVELTPIGGAADEVLYPDATVHTELPTKGLLTSHTTSGMTIARTGSSKTSALKFMYRITEFD